MLLQGYEITVYCEFFSVTLLLFEDGGTYNSNINRLHQRSTAYCIPFYIYLWLLYEDGATYNTSNSNRLHQRPTRTTFRFVYLYTRYILFLHDVRHVPPYDAAVLYVFFPPRCQAIELMKQAGVPPNTYCMNSLMAVSVQARQPNTALELFKEMERDGIPRDVVSDTIDP